MMFCFQAADGRRKEWSSEARLGAAECEWFKICRTGFRFRFHLWHRPSAQITMEHQQTDVFALVIRN
jgi:hypothetical protein